MYISILLRVICFLYMFAFVGFAQNNSVELYGKVLSLDTKKPLNAVSVNIKHTNISTVTNLEGEFVLKLPTTDNDYEIIFSLLGYETKRVLVSELKNFNGLITLKTSVNLLKEINISTYKDAATLVKKVFENRLKNFEDNTVFMTAFYRETIKRRQRNVSLTEAVMNVLKQPYDSNMKDIIKLNKARKSTDYKRLDTVSMKLQGGAFSSVYLDMMKYPDYVFREDIINAYSFTLDTPTSINDKPVYVVNFSSSANFNIGYSGQLFIDMNSLGLVSANYALDLSNKKKSKNFLVERKPKDIVVFPLEANYKVNYKYKDGKWYFNYSNIFLKFRVKKKRALFNKVYSVSNEMAITDWYKANDKITIKHTDRLSPKVIMEDAVFGFYDPDFWGEYNLIEPNKSIESAIKKIQKRIASQNFNTKSPVLN